MSRYKFIVFQKDAKLSWKILNEFIMNIEAFIVLFIQQAIKSFMSMLS